MEVYRDENSEEKELLIQNIYKHSLKYLMKRNLPLPIFDIFETKYGIMTFEISQVKVVN